MSGVDARPRLHKKRQHACYRCDRSSSRRVMRCPFRERAWRWAGRPRCNCRAFYSGYRPARVFCPADDAFLNNPSWEALLAITGRRADAIEAAHYRADKHRSEKGR